MKIDLIPNKSYSDCKYSYNREQWLNFARRITRNEFVLSFLRKRDGEFCSWCNKKLTNPIIHHISYEHFCTFNLIVHFDRPTDKRPNRVAKCPNCELCKNDNINRFQECMNKLVLVHGICNKEIAYSRENHLKTK